MCFTSWTILIYILVFPYINSRTGNLSMQISGWVFSSFLILTSAGASTFYYVRQQAPDDGVKTIALRVVDLANKKPNETRRQVAGAINLCIPKQVQSYWGDKEVGELSVDVYLKTFSLIAQDDSKADRDKKFKDWMLQADDKLSGEQRKSFIALMKGGMYEGTTIACVTTSITGLFFETPTSEFKQGFLSLAQNEPTVLSRYVAKGLKKCAPESSWRNAGDPLVLEVATATFARSMVMSAGNKSAEENNAELVPWLANEGERLSSEQKKAYIDLVNNGLGNPQTMLCIMHDIRDSMNTPKKVSVGSWNLRL
jgi:hypothetical protein